MTPDHRHDLPMDQLPEEDRGLRYDLPTLVSRRKALLWGGSVAALGLLTACAGSSSSDSTSPPSGATGEVPSETSGPYPGDGSNGVDVLDESGIVRSDIRSSLDGATTAEGVPLTFRITVRDVSTGKAMAGAGVYAWHCDRDGNYSMYSPGVEDETYLRGVQKTDAEGTVAFTSIFPACYSGRWPHIHFEVYKSVSDAVAQDGDNPIVKTSQLALPQEACEKVYATSGYEQSVSNLSQITLASDMVFGDDDAVHQLATMAGDAQSGYTASLAIGVVPA